MREEFLTEDIRLLQQLVSFFVNGGDISLTSVALPHVARVCITTVLSAFVQVVFGWIRTTFPLGDIATGRTAKRHLYHCTSATGLLVSYKYLNNEDII